MIFRFLISTIFAFLSVALLMDERKETRLKELVKSTAEIFDQDYLKQTNGSDRLLFERKSFGGYR